MAEIARGNHWYVADQFRVQMGSRGRRAVIEHRWHVFDRMLREWRGQGGSALTVLDAGCGDGINMIGLRRIAAAQRLDITVVGVDYNPVRLARARSADTEARLHRAALSQLPFASGSFDAILCNHVLEHVPELQASLLELVRVLRRGGLLIVGVPNEGCFMARTRNQLIQPAIGRTTDHVHFFTEASLADQLRGAGVRVRQVERETFFFPCTYVNQAATEFRLGHLFMAGLRRMFPSQAGGLIVAAEKPIDA